MFDLRFLQVPQIGLHCSQFIPIDGLLRRPLQALGEAPSVHLLDELLDDVQTVAQFTRAVVVRERVMVIVVAFAEGPERDQRVLERLDIPIEWPFDEHLIELILKPQPSKFLAHCSSSKRNLLSESPNSPIISLKLVPNFRNVFGF